MDHILPPIDAIIYHAHIQLLSSPLQPTPSTRYVGYLRKYTNLDVQHDAHERHESAEVVPDTFPNDVDANVVDRSEIDVRCDRV